MSSFVAFAVTGIWEAKNNTNHAKLLQLYLQKYYDKGYKKQRYFSKAGWFLP